MLNVKNISVSSWMLVAHPCNPSTGAAEIGKTKIQSQRGKIVCVTPSPKLTEAQWTGSSNRAPTLQVGDPEFKC
jgi:hypothetical protein